MRIASWKKDLDPNIIRLVRALNLTPGITTTQSCGGHDSLDWWVSFEIDQRPEGWGALKSIAILTRLFNQGDDLMRLSVEWGPFGLSWTIESAFGDEVTPDQVAERIECLSLVPPPSPELSYTEAVFEALEPAMVLEALRYTHAREIAEDEGIDTSADDRGSTDGQDKQGITLVVAS